MKTLTADIADGADGTGKGLTGLKCISLHEPWASAIALGLKTVETRSWATSHRGPMAIHAAKKWTALQEETHLALSGMHKRYHRAFSKHLMCFGAVIAVVELHDCKPTDKYCGTDALTLALGDFTHGRFAWMLRNVRKLTKPVAVIGRQGFFNVEIDMIAQDGGAF